MVLVGFAAPTVTNTLPSMIARLRTSWVMPHGSTTDDVGSSPMRAVPRRWLLVRIGALSIVCAPASTSDSVARSVLHAMARWASSLSRYVTFGAGIPARSASVDESSTRLSRCGRSSHSTTQRAPRPKRARKCS